MINPDDIQISALTPDDVDEVSWLLADSMCTNPNHMAIFKSIELPARQKQQQMFEMVLRSEYNKTIIAKISGKIVAAMSYTTCQHCQMSPIDILLLTPTLIRIFGRDLIPVLRWRMNWSKHDYKRKHIHFGPLAVRNDFQGMGIGKLLLSHFCTHVDAADDTAYLETDKSENIALYERFGFKIIETDTLFGNQNWFMVRIPLNK